MIFCVFILLSIIHAIELKKRSNAVTVAKTIYSAYDAYRKSTDNIIDRNIRNYAKKGGYCDI